MGFLFIVFVSGTGGGQNSGQKKININILGGTVSGTNRNRPWDKQDPFLGQIGARRWDNRPFSV